MKVFNLNTKWLNKEVLVLLGVISFAAAYVLTPSLVPNRLTLSLSSGDQGEGSDFAGEFKMTLGQVSRGLASIGKSKKYKKSAIRPDWNRMDKIANEVNGSYLGTSGTQWVTRVENSTPTLYKQFFDEKSMSSTKLEYNRMTNDYEMRNLHGLNTQEDQMRYLEKSRSMSQRIAEDAAERKMKIEGKEITENIKRDDNRELMTTAGAVGLAASLYKGRNLRVKLGDDARLKSHVSVRRRYGELVFENPVVDMAMQYAQVDQDPVKFAANRKIPVLGTNAGVSYGQKTQTRLASLSQPLTGGLSLGLETEHRGNTSAQQRTSSVGSTDNRVRLQYGVSF